MGSCKGKMLIYENPILNYFMQVLQSTWDDQPIKISPSGFLTFINIFCRLTASLFVLILFHLQPHSLLSKKQLYLPTIFISHSLASDSLLNKRIMPILYLYHQLIHLYPSLSCFALFPYYVISCTYRKIT